MKENEARAVSEADETVALVWECGPHTNAWKGHDARCRQVPRDGDHDHSVRCRQCGRDGCQSSQTARTHRPACREQ
jgi:hypothetical protein